jgi:hypothetical protein
MAPVNATRPSRVSFFSPDLAYLGTTPKPTMPASPIPSGVIVETAAILLTLLLGLATWGLYRLAVSLKEPS